MVKMSPHKCDLTCGGSEQMNGFYILCHSCLTPSYLACMQSNQEIKELIATLEIDKIQSDDPRNASLNKFMNTVFAEDSMFTFKCPECCVRNAATELATIKRERNKLKNQIKELTIELNTYKSNTNKQFQMDIDENDQNAPVTKIELQAILNKFESTIMDKLQLISKDSEQTQASKRKRSNTEQTTYTATPKIAHIDLTSTNNKKRDLLKAPITKTENSSVYKIRVSKFSNEMTPENLVQYIMANTNIQMTGLFKVETLNNPSYPDENISFKISTFSKEIKDMLMDQKLWEPEYKADEFIQKGKYNTRKPLSSHKKAPRNNQTHNDTHNRYENAKHQTAGTPARKRIQFDTPINKRPSIKQSNGTNGNQNDFFWQNLYRMPNNQYMYAIPPNIQQHQHPNSHHSNAIYTMNAPPQQHHFHPQQTQQQEQKNNQ